MNTFIVLSKGLKDRTRIHAEGFFIQDGTIVFHDGKTNWTASFPVAEVIAVVREDTLVPDSV